jgi:hypothetical protein
MDSTHEAGDAQLLRHYGQFARSRSCEAAKKLTSISVDVSEFNSSNDAQDYVFPERSQRARVSGIGGVGHAAYCDCRRFTDRACTCEC